MAQRSVWEVDTVRAQAKFLSITGAMKTVYYVLWRGFAAAEATWEPRSSFDREAIEQDVVPLENALERDAQEELEEHHRLTLADTQAKLQRAVRLREGEGAADRHISAFISINPLTARRLFGARLDVVPPKHLRRRTGRPKCRTWAFTTTAAFYHFVFPCTQLRRVAHLGERHSGERMLLATTASVHSGALAGEDVFVLATQGEDRVAIWSRLGNKTTVVLTTTISPKVEATAKYSSVRRSLRLRGALMCVDEREWAQVRKYMPRW